MTRNFDCTKAQIVVPIVTRSSFSVQIQNKMSEEIILESKEKICLKCGANISKHTRSSQILIYTETGPKLGKSIDKRCSNQECKFGYFLGYYTPKKKENDPDEIKIYHENALKEEYLISTSDTAFATSLLHDWVLNMKCGHQAFNTMAQIYNLKHQNINTISLSQVFSFKDPILVTNAWPMAFGVLLCLILLKIQCRNRAFQEH